LAKVSDTCSANERRKREMMKNILFYPMKKSVEKKYAFALELIQGIIGIIFLVIIVFVLKEFF
jgi:hypothetical protein